MGKLHLTSDALFSLIEEMRKFLDEIFTAFTGEIMVKFYRKTNEMDHMLFIVF